MNGSTSSTLSASGFPITNPNGVAAMLSIAVAYTVAGRPATMSITVEGISNANRDVGVLDTYTGTANTTRTINLTATYDFSLLGTKAPSGHFLSVFVGCNFLPF
jgi:hypothetical protein